MHTHHHPRIEMRLHRRLYGYHGCQPKSVPEWRAETLASVNIRFGWLACWPIVPCRGRSRGLSTPITHALCAVSIRSMPSSAPHRYYVQCPAPTICRGVATIASGTKWAALGPPQTCMRHQPDQAFEKSLAPLPLFFAEQCVLFGRLFLSATGESRPHRPPEPEPRASHPCPPATCSISLQVFFAISYRDKSVAG